jgi:chromosome transmission fidelity protein 1
VFLLLNLIYYTGTGKSLSLICGSLTWLRDHKRKAFQATVDATCGSYCETYNTYQLTFLGDDDEPEWMIEHAKRESRRAITEKRKEFEDRLAKIHQEEERLKQAQDSSDRPRKKQVRIYSALGGILY